MTSTSPCNWQDCIHLANLFVLTSPHAQVWGLYGQVVMCAATDPRYVLLLHPCMMWTHGERKSVLERDEFKAMEKRRVVPGDRR